MKLGVCVCDVCGVRTDDAKWKRMGVAILRAHAAPFPGTHAPVFADVDLCPSCLAAIAAPGLAPVLRVGIGVEYKP